VSLKYPKEYNVFVKLPIPPIQCITRATLKLCTYHPLNHYLYIQCNTLVILKFMCQLLCNVSVNATVCESVQEDCQLTWIHPPGTWYDRLWSERGSNILVRESIEAKLLGKPWTTLH